MTLPKIEVWNVNPHLPRSPIRWVTTEDGEVVKVSPSWIIVDWRAHDLYGKTLDYITSFLGWTVERDDRISDS